MLFTFLRVFGCARKMHFPEMLFNWPLNGCKLISVSILPSNRNFPENRERAEGEEDAPARRERERERERKKREGTIGSPSDFESVRLRRSTSQTQIVNPDREPLANPDREPRSATQIANPLRTQIANLDREPRSRTPCEPRSRTPIAAPIRRPRSRTQIRRTPKPIVLPPFFSQFDRIMIFFFLGFICVSV